MSYASRLAQYGFTPDGDLLPEIAQAWAEERQVARMRGQNPARPSKRQLRGLFKAANEAIWREVKNAAIAILQRRLSVSAEDAEDLVARLTWIVPRKWGAPEDPEVSIDLLDDIFRDRLDLDEALAQADRNRKAALMLSRRSKVGRFVKALRSR